MKQSDSYDRSIHRTGRLGSILAIAWMLGIPAVMCTVYHMFPSIPDLLLFGSGLLALYVPTAISRAFRAQGSFRLEMFPVMKVM